MSIAPDKLFYSTKRLPLSTPDSQYSRTEWVTPRNLKNRYPNWLNQWAKRQIFNTFRPMNRSLLEIRLPDQTRHQFGQTDPEILPEIDAVIQVHSLDFFTRCLLGGDVAFGEAYVEGLWDTPDIAQVIAWFIDNIEHSTVLEGSGQKAFWLNLYRYFHRFQHALRHNNLQNSSRNIRAHYDLSNEFFALFLDPTMTYSSGIYSHPELDLETAQYAKYDAICHKLRLSPDDHVLEIGCGWGGFAEYATQHYGCKIDAITLSPQQYEYATERIQKAGLAEQVTIRLIDYRHVTGQFDKIVSIEMIEAVGDQYYETYFGKIDQLLKPDGLACLQMITCADHRYEILKKNVDFIQKHIFPGTLLPSLARVQQALTRSGKLSLIELQDIGNSYSWTLNSWYERLNQQLDSVYLLGFDNAFIRLWNYYLKYCEAAFAMRQITVVQALMGRSNNRLLARDASL